MDSLNLQYLTSHSFVVNHYTQSEFWVLDEFLWWYYSNGTSSVVLSHSTIYLLITPSVCEQYAMVWPFFSSIFTWYYLPLALLKSSLEIQLKFDFCRFGDYSRIGFIFAGVCCFGRVHTRRSREKRSYKKKCCPIWHQKFLCDLRKRFTYRLQGTWSIFQSYLGSWQIVDHQLRRPGNARKGQLPRTC